MVSKAPIAPPPIMGMGGGMTGGMPATAPPGGMSAPPDAVQHLMAPPPAMNQPPFGGQQAPVNTPPTMNPPSAMTPGQPDQNAPSQFAPPAYAPPAFAPPAFPPPPMSAPPNISRPIKPDGFESSASNVALQQKYGHTPAAPPSEPLPPPPSFSSVPSNSSQPVTSAPRSLPPAGGGRYLAYDAVTGQTSNFVERKGGMGGMPPPPAMGGFSVFNPGATNGR